MPLQMIAGVFVLQALASIASLGSGFRGGLFFATLFMGALGGRLFADGVDLVWPGLGLDPKVYAVIGMSALSASVIGGPLTMSFIALEATGNLWLTTAVLVGVIVSQPRRCGLSARFDGRSPHARRFDNSHGRHTDRGIPRKIPARLEDAGRSGR